MSKFTTRIPAYGSQGNIFAVLGHATNLMKQLEINPKEIEKLRNDVMSSENYEQALEYVREWFPVDSDEAA